MKIGMNLLLWGAHITPQHYPTIERIKKAGFDGVEIPIFEGDENHFRSLGEELRNQGLGCTAVTVAGPETNPISPDPAVRAKSVERLKWVLDMCAALGAELIAGPYHSPLGVFTGQGPTEDEKQRAVETLRQGAEHAGSVGVKIAIEYLNRFETYFLTTAKDAAELVQAVDHPAFGMMFDTFHANIEEKNGPSELVKYGRFVNHIHISENDRGTPGTGHVQWDETFRAIRKIKYDGWVTIESFGRALPDLAAATRVWRDLFPSDVEVYTKGYKFIRKMLGGAAAGKGRRAAAASPAKGIRMSAKKAAKKAAKPAVKKTVKKGARKMARR
jgi:D-psicose/D-tagatose/L-ribulose 3-epimerase